MIEDFKLQERYAREEQKMGNENRPKTMTQPRSEIADALTDAVARVTGLQPDQIITISAGTEQILIGYTGAGPGLLGGVGRLALQTYDTRTGKLVSDKRVDDPEALARSRAAVESNRRSLFAQDHA